MTRTSELFISQVLVREALALEEVEGVWSIFFYDALLARFNERDGKVHP